MSTERQTKRETWTAGRWRIAGPGMAAHNTEPGRFIVADGQDGHVLIADCYPDSAEDYGLPQDYKANARLIAAAPEMAEVLRRALVCLNTDGPASCAASIATHGRALLARIDRETGGGR